MEKLGGTVVDTLFRNDENGYSVFSMRCDGELRTVVGVLPALTTGERVNLEGSWMQHPQYGKQFKATTIVIEKPTSLAAIEKYLGSGLIKGVGPSTARLIVETFGRDTLEVLSTNPERLREVPRIGKSRMKQISQGFIAQQASRGTYLFLQQYGISSSLSNKINKKYQYRAEALIRENPYRLIDDIEGVGFLTADRIALSLGIPRDSEFRMVSGVKYVLIESANVNGHTFLPLVELVSHAADLTGAPEETIRHHVQEMLLSQDLSAFHIGDQDAVCLPGFCRAEQEVAWRLKALCGTVQHVTAKKAESRISAFEEENSIAFSVTQRQAILRASQSGLMVITGGPGTGKTTLINCILYVLGDHEKHLLAAPTGRAAKRMSEATGEDAMTIHRMLQFGGEDDIFQRDEDNPLDCGCLIIDEMSMVDIFLMRSLLRAVKPGTRLLLVGDADQLPSVGAGNVLGDILTSSYIPQVRLTEIFRQSEQSMIIVNAHRINHGEFPVLNGQSSDFFFEKKMSHEEAAQCIVDLCSQRLPAYLNVESGSRTLQVLTPTKKGVCGVYAHHHLLQDALNPSNFMKPELQFGEITFRLGDKVMHTKNNYQIKWTTIDRNDGIGVFNGDIGYITNIYGEDRVLEVLYDEERIVLYEYAQLEELELAYCLSIHKSQGSEFPVVIISVVGGPKMLLTRNLLYTAVTRARQLVVLVGSQSIIYQMIENNHEHRRYTLLDHWLEMLPHDEQ